MRPVASVPAMRFCEDCQCRYRQRYLPLELSDLMMEEVREFCDSNFANNQEGLFPARRRRFHSSAACPNCLMPLPLYCYRRPAHCSS